MNTHLRKKEKNYFEKVLFIFFITLNSNTAKKCTYNKHYKELNFLKKGYNTSS